MVLPEVFSRWPALAGTATMGETTAQADRQKGR
jgi:hypothetical protein